MCIPKKKDKIERRLSIIMFNQYLLKIRCTKCIQDGSNVLEDDQ